MAERRERDRLVAASEADVSALFRPLARGVGAAVRRHAAGGVTPLARVLILREVDGLLDGAFGRLPNDPNGPLANRVAARSRAARAAAFGVQARRLLRVLPADVRRAVGIDDGR